MANSISDKLKIKPKFSLKEVKLPDDLAAALNKNKKEYIEWIVSAKREETQKERLKATMERLEKGWKNPANR